MLQQPELIPASAVPLFAALGDGTRLALLSRLMDGHSRSIVELSTGLPLTRQGVSKHLKILEQARMVQSSKVGRESLFQLDPTGISEARQWLEAASAQWDEAALRLKQFVESAS